MKLNYEEVKKILPHRDPFLFIDSVESVILPGKSLKLGETIDFKETEGAEIVAHYRTKKEHPIFTGHFPDNPILPGVVQVEMMAQASIFIITLMYTNPFQVKMNVALLGINEARFRKPILPEMDLVIKVKIQKIRHQFLTSDCTLYCGGQLMSESQVMAAIKAE